MMAHVRRFLQRTGYPPMPAVRAARMPAMVLTQAGRCSACLRSWRELDPNEVHETRYSLGSGCFTLCERCWVSMTPTERMPYYRRLWEFWEARCGGAQQPWWVIAYAVLYEPLTEAQRASLSYVVREWRDQLEATDVAGWENEGGALAA